MKQDRLSSRSAYWRRNPAKKPAAAVLAVFLVLFSAIEAPCEAQQVYAQPDFSKVDALIQTWVDTHQYPGAGIWIVDKDGRTLHERYWNGYTRETTVMIASASKWLEAATLMTLVDDKRMSLDAPISTYLPDLNGPQGANTLRQMFSHTSNLNHIHIDDSQGVDRFPALLAAGHTDIKPGEEFFYGGTALATASRAIEVVTGLPWLTVFAHNIALPCRMKNTVTGQNLWTFSQIVGGDNFPRSNAADYMNFLQMLLHDGDFQGHRVLSTAAVHEMEADQLKHARVKQPEYPEVTLGQKHHGVYGLGEWRLVEAPNGEATMLSSPSFAGFFPWIDTRDGIAGVFVGRVTGNLDAFHASAQLSRLVTEALHTSAERNRPAGCRLNHCGDRSIVDP